MLLLWFTLLVAEARPLLLGVDLTPHSLVGDHTAGGGMRMGMSGGVYGTTHLGARALFGFGALGDRFDLQGSLLAEVGVGTARARRTHVYLDLAGGGTLSTLYAGPTGRVNLGIGAPTGQNGGQLKLVRVGLFGDTTYDATHRIETLVWSFGIDLEMLLTTRKQKKKPRTVGGGGGASPTPVAPVPATPAPKPVPSFDKPRKPVQRPRDGGGGRAPITQPPADDGGGGLVDPPPKKKRKPARKGRKRPGKNAS